MPIIYLNVSVCRLHVTTTDMILYSTRTDNDEIKNPELSYYCEWHLVAQLWCEEW